jgi:antiviral helicase SLH1
MSLSLSTTESQWLSQLAAMRAAIAELNLSKVDIDATEYGHDLHLDDEDLLPIQGGDDLWDLISEVSEEAYTSGGSEPLSIAEAESSALSGLYDRDWLNRQCVAVSKRNSGLDAQSLQDQIEAILASDSNGKAL